MRFTVKILLSDINERVFKNQKIEHWIAGYKTNSCSQPDECKTLEQAIKACAIQIKTKETLVFDNTVIAMGNILSIEIKEEV